MSHNQTGKQIERSYNKIFRESIKRFNSVPIRGKRRGFLPFDTNPFDRVFVGVILTVAIHLLWMRFLEEDITLTVATILSLILSVLIFTRG